MCIDKKKNGTYVIQLLTNEFHLTKLNVLKFKTKNKAACVKSETSLIKINRN